MAVLEWCADRGNYLEFDKIWQYLNKCADLYGYWDDRLKCLDWLMSESERKADWKTFVKVTTAYSWTLILKQSPTNLEEAEQLQKKAWKLSDYADPLVKSLLVENIGVLHIRQNKYEKARQWFDKYKTLMAAIKNDDLQQQRSEIRLLYYEAEILYREKKYIDAKILYKKVVEKTEKINWLRFTINAKSWLASIATKEKDFDEAERLLTICLPVAKKNKDKRRTACCQFHFACLEKARGDFAQARKFAHKALDNFERLGVSYDMQEVQSFIDELSFVENNNN